MGLTVALARLIIPVGNNDPCILFSIPLRIVCLPKHCTQCSSHALNLKQVSLSLY